MIIQLNETLRVEVDRFNHTLQQYLEPSVIKGGPRKGEVSKGGWKELGYYANLKQCIKVAAENTVWLENESLTLEDYLYKIEEIEKRFEKYLTMKAKEEVENEE